MATHVSVHILLRDSAHLASVESLPEDILELMGATAGLPFGAGRAATTPPMPWVVQINLLGLDKIALGKRLLPELRRIGYEARLSFTHRSSTVVGPLWWPDAPPWPTWEWPPDTIAEWVREMTDHLPQEDPS